MNARLAHSDCVPPGGPSALPVSQARQAQTVRTLFTTEHAFDAGLAGFDGPTEPGTDGGFSVTFDGRHSIPSVVLQGSDGEIVITGWAAIQQACNALMDAEKLARRMAGEAA